jgi:hypothetical protein
MSDLALRTRIQPAPTPDGELLLSAFRKVAAALGLTLPEQAAILGVSRATVAGWKTAPGADPDKLDRMALFVGIFGLAGRLAAPTEHRAGLRRRPPLGPAPQWQVRKPAPDL